MPALRTRRIGRAAAAAALATAVAAGAAGPAEGRTAVTVTAEPLLARPALAANPNIEAPDSTGAVGGRWYVHTVNNEFAVFSRASLRRVATLSGPRFLDPASPPVFSGDPQILWDRAGRRWYFATHSLRGTDGWRLWYGWSRTSDPTDLRRGWCRFSISADDPTGRRLDDFPKLGQDAARIIIGSNYVDQTADTFTARVVSVPKPPRGDRSCAPPRPSIFGTLAAPLRTPARRIAVTPVPANPVTPGRDGWIVAAECTAKECGRTVGHSLALWKLTGPAATPRLVPAATLRVPAFRVAPPALQRGSPRRLDTLESTWLTSAAAAPEPRAGGRLAIWTQHTVAGPGGRPAVRWYEIVPSLRRVRQAGLIADPRAAVFNGAVGPTRDGDGAVAVYSVSSRTQLPSLRVRARTAALPPGRFGTERIIARSVAPNATCSAPPRNKICRWGDYSGAVPDPDRRGVVWITGQVMGPRRADPEADHWRTWIAAIRPVARR